MYNLEYVCRRMHVQCDLEFTDILHVPHTTKVNVGWEEESGLADKNDKISSIK